MLLLANIKKHFKITRVDKEWNSDLLGGELSKGSLLYGLRVRNFTILIFGQLSQFLNVQTLCLEFERFCTLTYSVQSLNSICVIPGYELEGLVHEQDGEGELEDNDPLVNGEAGDVEDNIEHGNVEDHEVKGERESHGQEKIDVDPWVHHEQ